MQLLHTFLWSSFFISHFCHIITRIKKKIKISSFLTRGVTVLANNPAMGGGRSDIQLLGEVEAESGRVQVSARADHMVLGETRQFPCNIGEDIHWNERKW